MTKKISPALFKVKEFQTVPDADRHDRNAWKQGWCVNAPESSIPVGDRAEFEEEKQRRASAYKRELRLLWISAALTAPLLADMIFRSADSPAFLFPRWLQLALATPVQFWIGKRFYPGVWHALRGGGCNMDVLVALGTSIAYAFSVVVTLQGLSHYHVYFEVSAAIVTLSLMGRLLEAQARNFTTVEIETLALMQPETARIEVQGVVAEVPVEQVKVGERVVIRPGEIAPIGGLVLEGRSNVDESMLTGERRPAQKRPGDQVYAGTLNLHGQLVCQAIRIGNETVLAQIIRLMNKAQGSRMSIQRFADRISHVFTPIVVGLGVVTFSLWWAITGDVAQALINAVAVLVIACPSALALAAPTAAVIGIGQGAQNGIFVRSASALERAEKLKVMALDKAGVLTEGKHSVTDIVTAAGQNTYDVLYLAAALAQAFKHPLAEAIAERAKKDGVPLRTLTDFSDIRVEGVEARIDDDMLPGSKIVVSLGSPAYLRSRGIVIEQQRIEHLLNAGKSIIGVAERGGILGYFAITDSLRLTSSAAVSRLKEMGLEVVMLSGDDVAATRAIAAAMGVSNYRDQVAPQDKPHVIRSLRADGKIVGLVGNGVNDARALAAADVSFALSAGAKGPIGTVDIALMKDDLASAADAISLSRATLAKVRQNLFFAFFYNVLGIPLAAFGMLNPVTACIAMALGSISILVNSLFLKRWKPADD